MPRQSKLPKCISRSSKSIFARRKRLLFESLEPRRLLASLLDFGDAPDLSSRVDSGDYQTLLENNGPSHQVSTQLYLGGSSDAEANGLPHWRASGDDQSTLLSKSSSATAVDDEDGVRSPLTDLVITAGSQPSVSVTVTNQTGQSAMLYGWIDVNADGVFDNEAERASIELNATDFIERGPPGLSHA